MLKIKHGADLLQFNHPQKQVKCLEMCLSSSGSSSNEVPIVSISMTGTWDFHTNLQQKTKVTLFPDSNSDQKESFKNKGTARNTDVEESENDTEENLEEVRDNEMKLRSDVQRKNLTQRQPNKRNTNRLKSGTQSKCKDRSGETFSSNTKRAIEKKRTKNRESKKQTAKQNASQTDASNTENNENVNNFDFVTVYLPFVYRR